MKIKKIDIFEGKNNLNYLFLGDTPEESEQEEQTIEEEEESEEGKEEGQQQEGQEVEQQQEGQEETEEETPEEEEEQQEEEEKKKGIENEEEEDKPLEEPTSKTSEDTHGGDEATNSIENSPNSSEEGQEEAQQQEGQSQQEEDQEETEQEGNQQEKGQGQQEGKEQGQEEGQQEEETEQGQKQEEGKEQEDQEEEEQQEESQEQEEGNENEVENEDNNDEQEDTENYGDSKSGGYNHKSLAKVRTDMRTGNLATRFSTFISKFAKQPSYLHKSGKKEIDIRRAIKRSITKEPIDTVYVDNNKKTVILFLDDSGSMKPFTNLLSILASIATKRGDAVIIHAPNGQPYIPIEDLLNPSKRAKILRDLSKVGINIPPSMIKEAVDEGYNGLNIGGLVRKTLKNQKIIFVGDYDGYFFPIELSWKNDVVWLAPVIVDLEDSGYDPYYDLHKDFKGMFVKLLTEDELRDAINELARIGYKPKTFLNFIKNYDKIVDNEDDYEEEEEQTN